MKNKFYLILFFFFLWNALFEQASAGVLTTSPRISVLLVNILNFLLYFLGFLAIISIIISGIIYVVSAGDERIVSKAKSALKNSIIGTVIALTGLVVIKGIKTIIG